MRIKLYGLPCCFSAAAGENVQCTFDDNDYFIIHCAKDDDTTLPNFVSHLRKSIKAEQKRELDLFEDTRVSQIQGTYADARLYRSEEPAAQALEGVGVSDEASNALETGEHSSLVPSTNFLIEHETITHTWRPATKGGLINLKSRDQVLGRVGTLSNCRLECSDSAHADILIRSDNQQAVDNAISKLNVLDGATHSYLAFPYVSLFDAFFCNLRTNSSHAVACFHSDVSLLICPLSRSLLIQFSRARSLHCYK